LTFSAGSPPRSVYRPISRVRYEPVDVGLSGVEALEEADARLRDAIDASLATIEDHVEWLGLRIRLAGRTGLRGHLESWREELVQQYRPSRGALSGCIESVSDATAPAIELKQLAGTRNPAGRLAEMLIRFQHGQLDTNLERLLIDAQEKQKEIDRLAAYQAIREDARPDRDSTRRRLMDQGMRLLNALLVQLEGTT
jgi:hypothetical protein